MHHKVTLQKKKYLFHLDIKFQYYIDKKVYNQHFSSKS